MTILTPQTLDELRDFVANKTPESIHLDYKASPALSGKLNELSKDVSAFANSDGGVLVFGIEEVDHIPTRLDEGVDHRVVTRERIEDLVQSNVSPRLPNFKVVQIPLNDARSYFVVSVEKSERAPHQDRSSFRYYKRHNFKSSPMEDYEVQDVRNRHSVEAPNVIVDVEVKQAHLFHLFIENVGSATAVDISFAITPPVSWIHEAPPAFSDGIKVMSPGRKLSFLLGNAIDLLSSGSTSNNEFTIEATWTNPLTGRKMGSSFPIDLRSFMNSSVEYSDLHRHGDKLANVLDRLVKEVSKLSNDIGTLKSIAGATGLDFSHSTWRRVETLLGKEVGLPRINIRTCSYQVLGEILRIDLGLAVKLQHLVQQGRRLSDLLDLDDLSTEEKNRLRQHFFDKTDDRS
jgi:hypothetical protein